MQKQLKPMQIIITVKDLLVNISKYSGYGIVNPAGLCKLNIRGI